MRGEKLSKHFVCVGAQKSGTTWLYEQFRHSNEVNFGFFKEIHYFDSLYSKTNYLTKKRFEGLKWQFDNNPDRVEQWMCGDFKNLNPQERKLLSSLFGPVNDKWYVDSLRAESGWSADFSPGYADIGVKGFEHLRSLCKRIHIIFILRTPVERAWSGLVHENRYVNKKNLESLATSKIAEWLDRGRIPGYTDYAFTIKSLLKTFRMDQLQFVFHDDIRSDPEKVIDETCKRIEISPPENPKPRNAVVFQSPTVEMKSEVRNHLRERWRPMVVELQELGLDLPEAWINEYSIKAAAV